MRQVHREERGPAPGRRADRRRQSPETGRLPHVGAGSSSSRPAPGMTQWESLKYKDQPYVRITPVKGRDGMPRELENVAIYYAGVGDVLTVTLNEKLLKRRHRPLAGPAEAARPRENRPSRKAKPWLGSNVALRVDHKILDVVNALCRDQYQQTMQIALLEQPADSQRVEAALSGPRPGRSPPAGLGRGAGVSGRRKVRLEREVSARWPRPSTAIRASRRTARPPRPC